MKSYSFENFFLKRLDITIIWLNLHLMEIIMALVMNDVVILILVNRVVTQAVAHVLFTPGYDFKVFRHYSWTYNG